MRLALAFLVLSSLACGGGPSEPAAVAAPDPAGAEAVIHALYQPYLNGGNGGRGIRTAGVATPALTALIEKAELDYDPVVNGQDFSIKDLKLTTQSSGATATVVAAFQNFDQPTRVTYTLTSSEGGWHVDDVRFEDGRSLRKELGG